MRNLADYSTCKEVLYIQDEEGSWFSIWQFNNEGVLRVYKNGYFLHEEIKTPIWLDELPKFNEV